MSGSPPMDLSAVRHSYVADGTGVGYVTFRRTLTPRWSAVWAKLLGGHLALATCVAVIALLERTVPGVPAAVAFAVAGGAALGFWLHYLLLFLHEGAHYNLAPSRRLSDLAANAFIGVILGSDVRAYRKVHFAHHRNLGTTMDTETSYFDPLNRRFLIQSLTGVRLVRSLVGYRRTVAEQARAQETAGPRFIGLVFLSAALVNAAIAGGALWSGLPAVAVAWVAGMVVFLPLFNTVRQVLENRSEFADDQADYRLVPHGPVNRLFGDGMLAATLGGAGFNRHLLHHWDPSISFTRLREVEQFLMRTESAPLLLRRQTTYYRACQELNRV